MEGRIKSNRISRTQIVIAAIGFAGVIGAALISNWPGSKSQKNEKLAIAGRVVDASTNETIAGAELTIAGRHERYVSEDDGNFRIALSDQDLAGQRVRLRVSKENYLPYDQSIIAPIENLIITMRHK